MTSYKNTNAMIKPFVLLTLGLLLQGCGGSKKPTSNEPLPTPPEEELVSSWSLNDAGFDGLVPLLNPRASFTLSRNITDSALSPDGSQIAFAQHNDVPGNLRDTSILLYSTANSELLKTIQVGEPLPFSRKPSLVWSSNATLHAIYQYGVGSNKSNHWLTYNTTDGSLLQSQTIDTGLPCNNFSRVESGIGHVGTQSLLYTVKQGDSDNETSHLCRLGLSDYSRDSAELGFNVPYNGYQVTSTDGTKTHLYEQPDDASRVFINTRVFDTSTLQETREPYPESYGTIELLAQEYSVVNTGWEYYFQPGNKSIDTAGGAFSASETGNVMVLATTSYSDDAGNSTGGRGHIRFTALPSGVVIGDAPKDPVSWVPHRHINRDGSIATVEYNGAVHVYDLSGRSQVSIFVP